MSTETTAGWAGDLTTSNVDNVTAIDNKTLTLGGEANAILAEDAIKIVYLVIGKFSAHRCLILCKSI